jgi:plasmid stability protein
VKNITLALDDETYRLARIRAAEEGSSVSALFKQIVSETGLARGAGWLDLAAEVRALTAGRTQIPSEVLQREGRNERGNAGGTKAALLSRLRSEPVVAVGSWSRDELYEDQP